MLSSQPGLLTWSEEDQLSLRALWVVGHLGRLGAPLPACGCTLASSPPLPACCCGTPRGGRASRYRGPGIRGLYNTLYFSTCRATPICLGHLPPLGPPLAGAGDTHGSLTWTANSENRSVASVSSFQLPHACVECLFVELTGAPTHPMGQSPPPPLQKVCQVESEVLKFVAGEKAAGSKWPRVGCGPVCAPAWCLHPAALGPGQAAASSLLQNGEESTSSR